MPYTTFMDCHIHLVDVRSLGPLDASSAFPFENHMSSLKKLLRKPDLPLEQLYNRICEEKNVHSSHSPISDKFLFSMDHKEGPLLSQCRGPQFQKVTTPNNALQKGKRDSCCVLSDGSVVKTENIAHLSPSGKPCIIGHKFLKHRDLYTSPCASSTLGIFVVEQPSGLSCWPLAAVDYKCVRFPFNMHHVVFPLAHTKI